MNVMVRQHSTPSLLGTGFYTVPEASRLLKIPSRNLSRWLGGYSHQKNGEKTQIPPLWTPQLPRLDQYIELGFRDLIELRFIQAFIKAGLGLKTIRHCLEHARECVDDDRPFSTRRFQTDGQTIFLDTLKQSGGEQLLDLKQQQYVLRGLIERTFKDLDIEADTVVRWRPFNGKDSIVVDPARAFGQPITTHDGVPTVALAEAVEAEGSIERAARIYDVNPAVVRDAVKFEEFLKVA